MLRSDRKFQRFEKLCAILSSQPGRRSTLNDLKRRNGFQEEEVRSLAKEFHHKLEIIEVKPQTGRTAWFAALKQLTPTLKLPHYLQAPQTRSFVGSVCFVGWGYITEPTYPLAYKTYFICRQSPSGQRPGGGSSPAAIACGRSRLRRQFSSLKRLRCGFSGLSGQPRWRSNLTRDSQSCAMFILRSKNFAVHWDGKFWWDWEILRNEHSGKMEVRPTLTERRSFISCGLFLLRRTP
jgi:hypothetical protein